MPPDWAGNCLFFALPGWEVPDAKDLDFGPLAVVLDLKYNLRESRLSGEN